MNIRCNNEKCTYQYGGDCTVMEHVKFFRHRGDDAEFLTYCTAFSEEYQQQSGELKSFKERNVFCDRKDCKFHSENVPGKCSRNSIRVITGLYGDGEARCLNYERKVSDD